METNILEQIGIILNVVAGLFMTPDAIGKPRLQRFEKRLETKLKNLQQILKDLYEKVEPKMQSVSPLSRAEPMFRPLTITIFAFTCLLLSPIFWWIMMWVEIDLLPSTLLWRIGSIFLVSIIVLIIFFVILEVILDKVGGVIETVIVIPCFLGILFIFVTALGIPLGLFFLFGFVLPKILDNLLKWVIARMETGEETVLSFMIIWGVMFFIIGNLFQFLHSLLEVKK